MTAANGFEVYRGPSAIDGEEIAVIVVGFRNKSTNEKTGAMLQSYILRADRGPVDAWREGLDTTVCGGCPHRSVASGGAGSCYVNLGQGPRAVHDAWTRGKYPRLSLFDAARLVATYAGGFRIGTYGDPGAVPAAGMFWRLLTAGAKFRTGYTHRYADTGADLLGLCMASVDTVEEALSAQARGWATFRVAPYVGGTLRVARDAYEIAEAMASQALRVAGEAQCPAAEEAGKRTTCAGCPLKCDGTPGGRLGIVIQAHGATKRRVGA